MRTEPVFTKIHRIKFLEINADSDNASTMLPVGSTAHTGSIRIEMHPIACVKLEIVFKEFY